MPAPHHMARYCGWKMHVSDQSISFLTFCLLQLGLQSGNLLVQQPVKQERHEAGLSLARKHKQLSGRASTVNQNLAFSDLRFASSRPALANLHQGMTFSRFLTTPPLFLSAASSAYILIANFGCAPCRTCMLCDQVSVAFDLSHFHCNTIFETLLSVVCWYLLARQRFVIILPKAKTTQTDICKFGASFAIIRISFRVFPECVAEGFPF